MNEKERVIKKIEKVLVKYREEGLNQDNVDFKNYAAHDILEIIGEAKDFVRKQERERIHKWGDEDCPHNNTIKLKVKRGCMGCWQALKEEDN